MQQHTRSLIQLIRKVVGHPLYGAEIGVFRGENAECILDSFPMCHLSLVDLWKEWNKGESYYNDKAMGRLTEKEWLAVMSEAIQRTRCHKITMYVMASKQAAADHKNGSLDFVFIDANHAYEFVKEDIKLWRPKIRKGGLIAGHDYGGRHRGVAEAVQESFNIDNLLLRRGRIWGAVI